MFNVMRNKNGQAGRGYGRPQKSGGVFGLDGVTKGKSCFKNNSCESFIILVAHFIREKHWLQYSCLPNPEFHHICVYIYVCIYIYIRTCWNS